MMMDIVGSISMVGRVWRWATTRIHAYGGDLKPTFFDGITSCSDRGMYHVCICSGSAASHPSGVDAVGHGWVRSDLLGPSLLPAASPGRPQHSVQTLTVLYMPDLRIPMLSRRLPSFPLNRFNLRLNVRPASRSIPISPATAKKNVPTYVRKLLYRGYYMLCLVKIRIPISPTAITLQK